MVAAQRGIELGRPPKPHKTERIRVYEDVARLIAVCAGAEGRDPVDWFSELVRPILQAQAAKALDKIQKPITEPKLPAAEEQERKPQRKGKA